MPNMILVYIEQDRGKVNELSFETLTLARQLAEQTWATMHAVVMDDLVPALQERLAAFGVSTIYRAQDARLKDYAPEAYARGIVQLAHAHSPEAVLAAGSDRGNEIMAHVAALMNLPMAANVVEVKAGEAYLVTRLRWGGSLLEEARLKGRVKLLTVAPNAISAQPASSAQSVSIQTFTPELTEKDFRVRVMERVETATGRVSLADARVVVGGGRGVGSAEGFAKLQELADLLGGAVGVSRAVTSLGWRPHADQVGQTGTRIAPELYIACGISGAIQHMIGCKGAKHLLAINTDPDAPIMSKADYAVIGDLHQIIPAISAEIKRRRGGRSAQSL